ncbi:hypothetical protein J6590_023992 [Homalodisca vitripennis]|nr:hypothetical protein J6590_023992 [Homalodisca vitripennis]
MQEVFVINSAYGSLSVLLIRSWAVIVAPLPGRYYRITARLERPTEPPYDAIFGGRNILMFSTMQPSYNRRGEEVALRLSPLPPLNVARTVLELICLFKLVRSHAARKSRTHSSRDKPVQEATSYSLPQSAVG